MRWKIMNQYLRLISLLFISCFILIACSNENEQVDNDEAAQEIDEDEQQNEGQPEENSDDEEDKDADALADEDHYIDGTVYMMEEENMIRVEAETNLVEGTTLEAPLRKAYGIPLPSLSNKGAASVVEEVDSDGNVTIDIELADNFFEQHNGLFAELSLAVHPVSFHKPEILEAYGANGEEFKGPLVYQDEVIDQMQILETSVVMKIGDEQTEYSFETPEREPLPDDYGATDIWIEAEVVDNDHQFLYIEGKTNLLEGVMLSSEYYADEDQVTPDRRGLSTPNVAVEP